LFLYTKHYINNYSSLSRKKIISSDGDESHWGNSILTQKSQRFLFNGASENRRPS